MGIFRMARGNVLFLTGGLLLFATLAWSAGDDFFILRSEVRRSQSGNNEARVIIRHSGYAKAPSFFNQNRICALFRDETSECASGRGSVRMEPGDNQIITVSFRSSEFPIKRIYLKD